MGRQPREEQEDGDVAAVRHPAPPRAEQVVSAADQQRHQQVGVIMLALAAVLVQLLGGMEFPATPALAAAAASLIRHLDHRQEGMAAAVVVIIHRAVAQVARLWLFSSINERGIL